MSKQFISQTTLEALTSRDLYKLMSILHSTSDLLAYSDLAHVVHDIVSQLVDEADTVANEAMRREPSTPDEARWLAWIKAQHGAWTSTDLTVMVMSIADAANSERKLRDKQEIEA